MATENPVRLFEQVLWVGLEHEINTGDLKPVLKLAFPRDAGFEQSAIQFCFPDLSAIADASRQQERFTFALTNGDGNRVFGCVIRVFNVAKRYPDCLCVLSTNPWYEVLWGIGEILDERMQVAGIEGWTTFMDVAYNVKVPKRGSDIDIRVRRVDALPTLYTLHRPDIEDFPFGKMSLQTLLDSLHSNSRIMELFSSLLYENRIIMHSNSLSKLSSCCLSAVSTLYPFCWQHIFIPVLPQALLSYCCAPMPFFVGVHSSSIPEIMTLPLEEVVFIDLDHGTVSIDKANYTPLPEEQWIIRKAITDARQAVKQGLPYKERKIRKAFSQFYLALVATYVNHITKNDKGKTILDKEALVDEIVAKKLTDKDRTRTYQILRVFTESQMFEQFVAQRLQFIDEKTPMKETSFDQMAAIIARTPGGLDLRDEREQAAAGSMRFAKITGKTKKLTSSLRKQFETVQKGVKTRARAYSEYNKRKTTTDEDFPMRKPEATGTSAKLAPKSDLRIMTQVGMEDEDVSASSMRVKTRKRSTNELRKTARPSRRSEAPSTNTATTARNTLNTGGSTWRESASLSANNGIRRGDPRTLRNAVSARPTAKQNTPNPNARRNRRSMAIVGRPLLDMDSFNGVSSGPSGVTSGAQRTRGAVQITQQDMEQTFSNMLIEDGGKKSYWPLSTPKGEDIHTTSSNPAPSKPQGSYMNDLASLTLKPSKPPPSAAQKSSYRHTMALTAGDIQKVLGTPTRPTKPVVPPPKPAFSPTNPFANRTYTSAQQRPTRRPPPVNNSNNQNETRKAYEAAKQRERERKSTYKPLPVPKRSRNRSWRNTVQLSQPPPMVPNAHGNQQTNRTTNGGSHASFTRAHKNVQRQTDAILHNYYSSGIPVSGQASPAAPRRNPPASSFQTAPPRTYQHGAKRDFLSNRQGTSFK